MAVSRFNKWRLFDSREKRLIESNAQLAFCTGEQKAAPAEKQRSAHKDIPLIRSTALIIGSLILAAFQFSPSDAEESAMRLSLEQARSIIRERGVNKAVETSLDGKWSQFLDAIATGEPSWLDIATELGRHSDAEASETLNAAMGEALRHAPREVLQRLDGEPFRAEGVCGNCFADMGIQGATDVKGSIASQEAAVANVQDLALGQRRDYCLELIRQRKKP